jgi:hypothetical protein
MSLYGSVWHCRHYASESIKTHFTHLDRIMHTLVRQVLVANGALLHALHADRALLLPVQLVRYE